MNATNLLLNTYKSSRIPKMLLAGFHARKISIPSKLRSSHVPPKLVSCTGDCEVCIQCWLAILFKWLNNEFFCLSQLCNDAGFPPCLTYFPSRRLHLLQMTARRKPPGTEGGRRVLMLSETRIRCTPNPRNPRSYIIRSAAGREFGACSAPSLQSER